MQGNRIVPNPDSELQLSFSRGDYGKDLQGIWWGRAPRGYLSSLSLSHEVVEHADATITVSPSLIVNDIDGNLIWHGNIERGIWIENL